MIRQFRLHLQKPKSKDMGVGVVDVSRKGEATFFKGNGEADSPCVATMERARLDFIAAHGVLLSGMEPAGVSETGVQEYNYQEWWLTWE